MIGRHNRVHSERKSRLEIHETTCENDIRYRGPLSPTHFRVLGWLCIALAQVTVIFRLRGHLDPEFAAGSASWLGILEEVSQLALPFLLIVNFAQLLNARESYKKQLIINSVAMAGVCALFYLVFYRYIVGNLAMLIQEPSEALPTVKNGLSLVLPYGFFAFNIFVDLFLCTLTMIFLNYNPRRVFIGKARIFFRMLALLPVACEVGCMLLKLNAARGQIQIPVWCFPLLTVKPPMTFVLFAALCLFVKARELRFRRHGKTHEEYHAFLKTRRNAWSFSLFLSVMLVVVSVADLAVVLGFSIGEMTQAFAPDVEPALTEMAPANTQTAPGKTEAALPDLQPTLGTDDVPAMEEALKAEKMNASIDSGIRLSKAVGFGGSFYLIFLAPVVLLFCYTRQPKNSLTDILIPVAGMFLILFVYIEGFHQLLGHLPIEKVNLKEFKDMVAFYIGMLQRSAF